MRLTFDIRTCLACLLLPAIMPSAVRGDAPSTNAAPDAPPSPRIVCAEPEYDFGDRMNTATVLHTFKIRNAGSATLRINKVSASCGCTVATISRKQVPPGETATLRARLNLRGRRGMQKKSIKIKSNDPADPLYRLWMKGTAVIEIGVEPTYVNFGQVTGTNAVTREVRLVSRDPSIEFVTVRGGDEQRISGSITQDANGRKRRLRVVAQPPFEQGFRRTQLTVTTTHPKRPRFTLPVSMLVPQPIVAIPRKLSIRGNYPGGLTRAMLIRPGTVRSFKILDVDLPAEGMSADISPAGRNNYRIIIKGIPTDASVHGKSVVVRTDASQAERISVPIQVLDLSGKPRTPPPKAR